MLLSTSRSHIFYRFLISEQLKGNSHNFNNILSRAFATCNKYDISLVKYMCTDSYLKKKNVMIQKYHENGIADTIHNKTSHSLSMINDLLSSFYSYVVSFNVYKLLESLLPVSMCILILSLSHFMNLICICTISIGG